MIKYLELLTFAAIISSLVIQHLLPAPGLFTAAFLLPNLNTKIFLLPPSPQAPLDLFSNLKDRPIFLFGEQLASGFTLLTNAMMTSNPAISPPGTLKLSSNLNVISVIGSTKYRLLG